MRGVDNMKDKKTLSFEDGQYSKLVDDIYFYLYNNYKEIVISEGDNPVTLPVFIDAFLNDVEQFKEERHKNLKYRMND